MINSRRMGLERHKARRQKRNTHRLLVGKSEGKGPLGKSRGSWVDNIKMDLAKRMGWCGLVRSGSG
jgi:hypothetical protein